jgi:cell division protein FtsW (lipid II flippase)
MKQISYDEQVRQFLNEVCRQVKAKEVHREIKLELQSHILELVEEQLAAGIGREQAIEQALRQMGNPGQIGNQLHLSHRPRIDWSLIGLIAMFIGIGLAAMYAVELASSGNSRLFFKKIAYSGIGIVLMLGLCFSDYRKLLPYSRPLYVITLLVMLWTLLFGQQVNGSPYLSLGFTTLNFVAVSPFLLILCLAGIMTSQWKSQGFPMKMALYVLIPGVLYAAGHSIISLIIYLTGFGFMYFSIRRHIGKLLCYITPLLMIGLPVLWTPTLYRYRFLGFINPYSDPLGSGYMTIQSIVAIQSAGWWGHGFASVLRTLPIIESEMLFTYLTYSLGWTTGIGICGVVVFFLLRLADIANKIKDSYGKLVVKGLLAIFSIQFIWSILMSFGLLPMSGISLPFISNGGMLAVMQMASIGIILNIYRQKDMIPSRSSA